MFKVIIFLGIVINITYWAFVLYLSPNFEMVSALMGWVFALYFSADSGLYNEK